VVDASDPIHTDHALFTDHNRRWMTFDYVYPVISRRSRGLSLGINLNVDDACNFDCIYCQVDRTQPPARRDVDLNQLRDELAAAITLITTGQVWKNESFRRTPLELRRFADIAFSGNGEPTASPVFAEACHIVAELRAKHVLSTTEIVIITNATRLDRAGVQQAIASLDDHGGVLWAKLDAGTQRYFERIDRPRGGITLDQITWNITQAAIRRPLVIQSMFLSIDGQPPEGREFASYVQRLAQMLDAGAELERVQLYTIARPPADSSVGPLNRHQLDSLVNQLATRLPDVPCSAYYAPD